MSEGQHIPYQASALPVAQARSVLVLAPHPDDETIGCGGSAALYAQAGIPVQALVFTDGALWGVAPPGMGVVEAREAETRAAAQVLGCAEPLFARHPDRHLPTGSALVGEIVAQVRASRADTVFAPSLWEVHPDHRALAQAAIAAIVQLGAGHTLVQYEVGMPLLPNVLVDITPVLQRKQQAMACFASQLAMQAYDRHVNALNVFRTYTLPAAVLAAEGFRVCNPQEARDDPYGLVFQGHAHPALTAMSDSGRAATLVDRCLRALRLLRLPQ
ncbi:MAG TPA: PIG-L deacetylase family protein [Acidovorax sp.]